MNKKNNADNRGFVYSTDPNFQFESDQEEILQTPEPAIQKLIVRLETKHRAGKMVTLIDKFIGTSEDAEKLARQLRNYCGTGGSFKDSEIIVQGDQREKVVQFLLKNGYAKTRKL
jgi:translation initiation factor 1